MSSNVPLIGEFSDGVITKCNANVVGEYDLDPTYNGVTITEFGKSSCAEINGLTKLDLSRTYIQTINSSAFIKCLCLQTIILPETLTYIGYNAFAHSNLSTLKLPDDIIYFNSGAVNQVLELESINISNSNIYLSEQGFLFDIAKTSLIFCPRHVVSVDEIPFFDNITTIADCALTSTKIVLFVGKHALRSLINKAFHAMRYLITIDLSSTNISVLPAECFWGSSFVNLYLPIYLKVIQTNTFYLCSNLKLLVLYSNITSIQSNIISECRSLKKIVYFGVTDFSEVSMFKEESLRKKVQVFVTEFYQYSQFGYINVNKNWYRQIYQTYNFKSMNHIPFSFVFISLFLIYK